MRVSVVIPTYSMDRYDDFVECVGSVLTQTYQNIEVVIIVDGNEAVYDRAVDEFGERDDVVIYCNSEHRGPISRANMGAVQASGDIVALTDDDAIVDDHWVEELVSAYDRHDAIAVGGRIEPEWVAGRADYIPEEFYWLIGATYKGFEDREREVRNTFGANLSFRREVFLNLGGIRHSGIQSHNVQGRETEFCARMYQEYNRGVIYTPSAVVYHRIYEYRMDPGWLLRRAFWQGYSKRAMETLVPQSSAEESGYLRRILFDFIPERITGMLRGPESAEMKQFVWLILLLAAVGIGYLYGVLRWR